MAQLAKPDGAGLDLKADKAATAVMTAALQTKKTVLTTPIPTRAAVPSPPIRAKPTAGLGQADCKS